ncbi:MAG: Tfp pilus assembly protein FimT/FimU, partial [Alphaproteobacteria bacterium]
MGKSVESTHQFVIPRLTGNPAENKALNTAGCWVRSGMTSPTTLSSSASSLSLSFSGLTRGSIRQGFHTQRGRSMVEMLGVLAIMGVLSVGGVSMYSSAMSKHRANEILNEASKRAITASIQLTAGHKTEDVFLAEFDHNDLGYAKFKTTINKDRNILQFNIQLESSPGNAICQNIKSTIGKNTPIRSVNEDCTEFTFNPDLTTNDNVDVGNCENGNVYLSYESDPCTISINEDVSCAENSDCGNPNWGACCVEGKCAAGIGSSRCITIREKCVKNSDCPNGYFCNLMSKNTVPKQGTCIPLGTALERPTSDVTIGNITYKAKSFLMYNFAISWWGAQNWCRAHGMRMATLDDLGLVIPTNKERRNEDTNGHVFTDEEQAQFGSAINCCFWTGTSTAATSSIAVYHEKTTPWQKNTGMRPLCVPN